MVVLAEGSWDGTEKVADERDDEHMQRAGPGASIQDLQ